jgi:hypothetical protein
MRKHLLDLIGIFLMTLAIAGVFKFMAHSWSASDKMVEKYYEEVVNK